MTPKTVYEWKRLAFDFGNLFADKPGPSLSDISQHSFERCDETLKAMFKTKKLGFYDWPNEIPASEKESLKKLSAKLKADYKGAVLCGIGGSHLGAAAILEALSPKKARKDFPLLWLSNIDPWAVEKASDFVKERGGKVATVLISKSGSTTETLAGFCHLSNAVDAKGIVAITDPSEGELRRMVKQYGWPSFPVPQNIGGRFSVLTSVGLLPCLLGDVDIDKLLLGASDCKKWLESHPVTENPAYVLAWALSEWDRKYSHSIQYLMPYAAPLKLFADWFVQLWGESLGKKLTSDPAKSVGPTPVAALGTTDQHSLLQLFREGPNNKVVGFVDATSEHGAVKVGSCAYDLGRQAYLSSHSFDEISAKASRATEQSLRNGHVPTFRIAANPLDEHGMGGLLFFFETACAFAGELYGVDAFNQPGVEESKKLLRASL
jgi:glucose-6-phosphate isomerase